ncbi:AAA family ATPase [Microvirga terrae]|uniref:AAA family ATPase n=1 Tax=Microvirga terrae TaxID=2740529 RepID=A0ABY5RMR5_9HYPH|nr:AAA family ATPase [Microvirga terrae]UVF18495.1 AAA family ATPase [Microvirga terrae]
MNSFVSTSKAERLNPESFPWQSVAQQLEAAGALDSRPRREATRIPYIGIQAFCDSPDVVAVIQSAASDRLMSRAHVTVREGGIAAATALYQNEQTPQLIVIESCSIPETFLVEIDSLAEVCDAGTKVMVIGHVNDVHFYRELMRRGISDYLLAPVDPVSLIVAISRIYSEPTSGKLGQCYAFVGAKGGVGSSTVAHNVGWTVARQAASDVVLADMDLAFGTASLDFKLDAGQGVAEAIDDAGRLDEVLLDRLLARCGDHFSLLRAPGTLERCYDLAENAVNPLIEIAQASVPFLILDMPHVWNAWARNVLLSADEVIITAAPDLPNLRNAKSLVTFLRQARPHDPPPKLILNQVGMPKRPEIKPAEFAKALQLDLMACIPYDPHLFGTASNVGQMVAEVSAKAPASRIFSEIAGSIAAQKPHRRTSLFNIASMIKKMTFSSKTA